MAIDSHMHCNSILYNDYNDVIKSINDSENIEKVINVGLNIDTSIEAINISNNNPKFYTSIGIHPSYIKDEICENLYSLADNPKVVAIGEIGLDYFSSNIEDQKWIFIKQIMIANELKLPVIIHSNNTNQRIIEIFEKYAKPNYGCVFHCFQPDLETLKYLIRNQYYISFAGKVTYKTAKKSIEIARLIPNDLFLLETDSPYFSPEPFRDKKNNSSNIKYIIQRLADVKSCDYKTIEDITNKNTKRLFKKIL